VDTSLAVVVHVGCESGCFDYTYAFGSSWHYVLTVEESKMRMPDAPSRDCAFAASTVKTAAHLKMSGDRAAMPISLAALADPNREQCQRRF
jgi:hypothetical protein